MEITGQEKVLFRQANLKCIIDTSSTSWMRSIAHYTSQVKYRSLCRGLLTRKIKEDNEISYLVCHMEKYHKTDIAPVEQENERDVNHPANNPQIDCTRTLNNYNVIKRQCSYTQHINKRIADSTCLRRLERTQF